MDKFEVYNKTTGQWDSGFKLVSGWNESFVLDKTTDSGNVKAKYYSENSPKYKKGDWCRIVHGESATYRNEEVKIAKLLRDSHGFFEYELQDEIVIEGEVCYKTLIITPAKPIIEQKIMNIKISAFIPNRQSTLIITKTIHGIYGESYTLDLTSQPVMSVVSVWCEQDLWIEDIETEYYPLNHEQYLIKSSTYVKSETNDYWDCQITLEEPIEFTNGINCETMSFTNQGDKLVDIGQGIMVKYAHEPLTHLSVLEKVLKVTPANNNLLKSWFNRIKICDRELLQKVQFNDDTFNEQTLYGILMNKYDSSIGQTPVMYFDIDGTTDLPRETKYGKLKYLLKFMRQDGFDKEEIDFNELKSGNTQFIENNSADNFADGIISNFDNLCVENAIDYISEYSWAIPEIDTADRDVTQYDSGNVFPNNMGIWILKTQHKIKKVLEVKEITLDQLVSFSEEAVLLNYNMQSYNITSDKILEKRQYEASDFYKNSSSDDTKRCFWYSEGENQLHINDYYYNNLGGQAQVYGGILRIYQIKYVPLVSARYDVGEDYQIQINQTDSQIESNKFSKFIKDYLDSMNKPDIIIQKTYESLDGVIDLIGSRVVDSANNKVYLITNMSIQNRNFDYDVIFQLNENHIRRSDTLEAPNEIRKNLAISTDGFKERKSMLTFKLKLTRDRQPTLLDSTIKKLIFSALDTSNNNTNKYPQMAYLEIESFPIIKGEVKNTYSHYIQYLLCEISRYVINNTICFSIKFNDNSLAGIKKTLESNNYVITSTKAQLPILYTDMFGEIKNINLKLIHINSENLEDLTPLIIQDFEEGAELRAKIDNAVNLSQNYPLASAEFREKYNTEIENPILNIEDINYHKDMLDQLNYTVGFKIDTDDGIILSPNFFNNSILMAIQTNKVSYIQTFDRNITFQDYDLLANSKPLNDILYTNYVDEASGVDRIEIVLADNLKYSKSLVLLDNEKKPLIIINDFEKGQEIPNWYCETEEYRQEQFEFADTDVVLYDDIRIASIDGEIIYGNQVPFNQVEIGKHYYWAYDYSASQKILVSYVFDTIPSGALLQCTGKGKSERFIKSTQETTIFDTTYKEIDFYC